MDFFTDPYKDELMYSAIARYHYYIGNTDCKDTLEELFGKRSITASFEIGSNIDVLARTLGHKYTAGNIIKNHTIFPFYSPFLPEDRKKDLIEEIKYKDGKGLYAKIGIIAGSICKKNGIYYCPCCASREIEQYGQAFIHREHQLQGVCICPHDGVELKKYPVDKSNSSIIKFIRLDKRSLDLRNITLINSKYYDKLYKLSKDAYYLLQTDLENINSEKILRKYKNILYAKGLTTSSKKIRQIDLYDGFINFYGRDFLKIMESNIDYDDEFNWLKICTRNSRRSVHPMRHLLLINFLEEDIEKFFKDINKDFKPFGEGPWPCLNQVADHYKQNVVRNLKVTDNYKTRVPLGTFTCDCGFVYSRNGPDKVKADKYKLGKIKNFGKVWESKLKTYLKKGKYGLVELARLMQCDPKTIIKFDKKLEINYFKSKIKVIENNNKIINNDMEEIYIEDILKTIEINPTLSRTEIKKICKKQYTYLYRRNKKLLFDILPQKTRKSDYSGKIDWETRDKEILNLIKIKYKELSSEEFPIRITKTAIGKATRKLHDLLKNINRLPKTEKYLSEIVETIEEFQIRKCKKIIDDKLENEENITLSGIKWVSGIRTKHFEKIREEVLKYINMKKTQGKIDKQQSV